jgi:hypothetical protein
MVLAGCGGSEFDVAPAKGKVVCRGLPVSAGTVIFSPIAESTAGEPGKPATATVQPDGTFVLSTYSEQDGAVIGKHRVMYSLPENSGEDDESAGTLVEEGSAEERRLNAERAKRAQELAKGACMLAGEMTVDVTADGPNEFTLELVPGSPEQPTYEEEQ